MSVPQRGVTNPEELEHAPGRERENLEGWIPELATGDEIRAALEKAFDYRGDVSVTLKTGEKMEGYIFDRRTGQSLSDSVVRLYPKSSPTPTLPRSPSPAKTPPPVKPGKPG